MEAEAAVQLNLGFESSRENIGQAKFASNRDDQNSFFGRRSRGLFAQSLFHRPDFQLWKVILALAVLIFVLFASIAMLVHFASAAAAAKVSPHDSSDHHHHNHPHPTVLHFKLENKSEVVSPSPLPPTPLPATDVPVVIQEQSKAAADVINSTTTSSTTTPLPLIVDHYNETTTNASTNATVVQPPLPWTPHCGTWELYKDESCFHLFTGELWTWEEAAERCRGMGLGVTMLSIRDAQKQHFFREYIFGQQHKASFEDVWLGARYRNASADFRWADDGQTVVYGDWAPEHHFSTSTSLTTAEKHGNSRQGRSLLWFKQQQHSHSHEVDALYDVIEGKATLVGEEHVPAQPSSWLPPPPLPPLPSHLITPKQKRQYTDQDCLHLTAYEARWEATPCAKRNLVLCEVLPLWSFAQFQRQFLDFRKETEQKVAAVIPVGFVYSQFDGQQQPPFALWPAMTWAELPGKTVQDARGNLVETIRFWKRIA